MRHKYNKLALYSLTLALLLTSFLFLGACDNKKSAQVSEGHEDNVRAFLLIFDTRSDQQQLVRDMEDGKIPTRIVCEPIEMVWVEKKDSQKTQEKTSTEEGGPVDRDMELVEQIDQSRVYTTEDEQQIRKIYRAMTDMIVVGQTEDQNNPKKCRITYYLQDGTESVFDFDSVGLIKIGGQEYVLESDGSFWKLLPDMF